MPTLAFYKPYDVLSAFTDRDSGRTLAEFIDVPGVYPMGRLDKDSEGLLLLSDDGELAHLVTHPRHHLPKVYLAQVERIPDEDALERLRTGVEIKGRVTRPARAELLAEDPGCPPRSTPIRYRKNVPTAWVRITLWEAGRPPDAAAGARRHRADQVGAAPRRRVAGADRGGGRRAAQGGAMRLGASSSRPVRRPAILCPRQLL